ncbi:hypothetical protein F5148DRAFT_1310620 [Russula earlei]|uniref:Uncharacterized protein n=1 Tax=Russula earlei TaxID=71964 RepID=A0ACC0ULL4_9AGAM|nr:hypothetical protein F5148DRAFT_1310620 [Russula earlei]
MTSSVSDTTHSPAPFSPFSTHSGGSDLATSDESPDLGAFSIVFRALNDLQPRNFIPHSLANTVTPTASTLSPTESESDPYNRGSTVWTQQPVASYLSVSSRTATTRLSVPSQSPPPSEPPSSDTEGEIMIDRETDGEQPSLGYLDEALQFIAAERAKLTAPRGISWQQRGNSSTSDDPSSHHQYQYHHQQQQHQQLTPRRRLRKRKARSIVPTAILVRESSGAAGDDNQTPADVEVKDPSDLSSPDNSSSEAALQFRSTPGSPRRKERRRNSLRSASADGRPRLGHSKSTPTLRPGPLDPRVVRLRALAIKLKFLFAAEAELLTAVLSNDSLLSSSPDLIDPRGPPPSLGQPLVHVFIDYSNILIGFLIYLRRHPHHLVSTKVRWMSHAALALILERGRSVTRRVLVASSPLYQSVEPASQLGYEVHVYARVPDNGDGPDRSPLRHRHSRRRSGGSGSGSGRSAAKDHPARPSPVTESSEPGTSSGSAPPANPPRPAQLPSAPGGGRVRFREQGVDELLQLKFLQAVAAVDVLPPGSTIVLATGDGNVGQFNEDGFRGCVRTALKKGWRVELYAWEGGLSRTWVREFAEGSWASRFRIIPMDGFGGDLLDG